MWHVSLSSRHHFPTRAQHDLAAAVLEHVGGPGYWWHPGHNRIGHMRVPTTPDEVAICGLGNPLVDAGLEGTWRNQRPTPTRAARQLLSTLE